MPGNGFTGIYDPRLTPLNRLYIQVGVTSYATHPLQKIQGDALCPKDTTCATRYPSDIVARRQRRSVSH